mgnify:CR=1 FL=1
MVFGDKKPSQTVRPNVLFSSFLTSFFFYFQSDPSLIAMLKRLLSKLVENEHDSEIMRQKLFGRVVSNYKRLYEQLDVNKNGVLTKNDLAQLINEHGVFATGAELNEIVRKYSKEAGSAVLSIESLFERVASQI